MKKIEVIEKDSIAMKKAMDIQSICIKNVEEMIKKLTINTKYVEEEIFIDFKYIEKDIDKYDDNRFRSSCLPNELGLV